MGKSFKIRDLEQEAGVRVKKILKQKLTGPLSKQEISSLCHVPFDIIGDALNDPMITRVKTPLGDFTKYYRNAYNIFAPRTKAKVVVKAAIKLKFLKSDHVPVKVNKVTG